MHNIEPIIRKSRKAKNIIIKITYDAKVLVTIPHGVANSFAEKFIADKKDWIYERLEKLSQERPVIKLENGAHLSCMGRTVELQIINTQIATIKVFIEPSKILVFINKNETKTALKAAISKALKKEFKTQITKIIQAININKNFKYNRIAIKDNRSNWGSCSTKGNLNFNWRLIFAPLDIIEYVAVHELCHLTEHNHSAAYWSLVESICPDYRQKRNWLKLNGHKLSL
jgi:predicted metal-dependent hydrolase